MFRFKMVFLVLFAVLQPWQAQAQHIITWQSITHRHNPAYIKYVNSNITHPHNLTFSIEVGFLDEISCETMYVGDVKAQQPGKNTLTSMLSFKYNLRDLLKNVRNNFVRIIFGSLKKYSNTPKTCPIKPKFVWVIYNYSVPIEQFPIILSEINFLFDLNATRPNNDFLLRLTAKGRVECKERKRFGCGTDFKRG